VHCVYVAEIQVCFEMCRCSVDVRRGGAIPSLAHQWQSLGVRRCVGGAQCKGVPLPTRCFGMKFYF